MMVDADLGGSRAAVEPSARRPRSAGLRLGTVPSTLGPWRRAHRPCAAVWLIVFAALLRGLVGALLAALGGTRRARAFLLRPAHRDRGRDPRAGSFAARVLRRPAERIGLRHELSADLADAPALGKLRRGLPAFPVERPDLSQVNHGSLIGVWKYPPAYYLLARRPTCCRSSAPIPGASMRPRVSSLIGAITVWLVLLLLLEAGATRLG